MLYKASTVSDQKRAALEDRMAEVEERRAALQARIATRTEESHISTAETPSDTATSERATLSMVPDGLSQHALTEITREGKVTWTSSRLADAKVSDHLLDFLKIEVF